ncbi:hypothetical protein VPH35_050900 [Triticum aestivum]
MFSTIIGVRVCSYDICLHYLPFQLSPCGKHILLGGNFLLHTFHFHPDNLVCSYLSRVARGDHQNDDDDFMDAPQQNRATGRRKDDDEKKKRTRNRASQERLTSLTGRFTDDQKGAAAEMGMQALMDVREFVIPGCGRLSLDEESVFCTLGVPRGKIKVPYEVNNKIEEMLFPRLFPGLESMPNTIFLADSLQAMTTHEEVFKMKLLMYLISAVFAPTTFLRPSNKCFPILVNDLSVLLYFLQSVGSDVMCKLGTASFFDLMYVDCLDLSTVDFTGTGGPPPTHKFVVSVWTYDAVKAVLAADRVTDTKYGKLQLMAKHAIDYSVFGGPQNFGKWMDVHSAPSCPTEHLIGQFASGMTSLLGKLVEGWTSLNGSGRDAVARRFTTFVHDTDDDEHVEVRAGGKKGKAAPDVPSPEKVKEHTAARGEGVLPSKRERAPEDVGQGSPGKRSRTDPVAARRRVKKTTTRVTKHIIRDPLEHLHSKLSTGGNSDVHEAPVDKTAAAPSTVPTSSDASGRQSPPVADVQATTTGIRTSGSDESVSARTTEILPTLLAMKDAAVSHATPSASVEVDAPETNLSEEDSRSSDTDSKRVRGGTTVSMTEVAEATVHSDMPSTGESLGTTAPAPGGAEVAKATVLRAGLPPRRRSPRKQSTDIPNAPAVARSSRDESGYVPASTLFPPPAKINVMEKPEDRSTTDAGVKPGTSDGGEHPKQTASLPAVENPNLNLPTSKLPVNVGVPYSPNKKVVKKAAADTADNTPRPMNKPDDSAAVDSDMFVDLSSLDSAPQVVRGLASRHERHPMAFTPPSFSLGISQDQPVVQDPTPVTFAFPGGMAAMMAHPMVEGRKAVKFAEPIISPPLDEVYRRIEEAALQRRSSRGQGQSSSNVPAETVSEDTIRSATPGSVKQTKVIQCEATYVDLGDLAMSVRPLGKMSTNVVACGIDFINRHMDMSLDKTIMHYSVTCKIWDGDFHHKILRKYFAAHGEFKLTMKKCDLAPHDPHDKCGHHYAIFLDMKNQRFEVLDSMHSAADADLTTHDEYFINNLKEIWNRHYEHSKVQIRHFPIETDCGFHTLEYLAKWEGRLVPVVTVAMVIELRKIYTWNWLTNEDFNTWSGAREFVEEAVKKVTKKYK